MEAAFSSASTLPSSLDAKLMRGAWEVICCIALQAEAPETRRGDKSPRGWGEDAEKSMSSVVGENSREKILCENQF